MAARAGVSVQTVWQILGGRGQRYGAATRARVQAAADELGYRPHSAAKAVSTGRFGAVAMLTSMSQDRSVWDASLWRGISTALEAADLHLVLANVSDEQMADPDAPPKLLRQRMADALLLNYVYRIPPDFERALLRHRPPAVWINRKLETDAVFPDDVQAGRLATTALIAAGHRRIAYLSAFRTPHHSDADRQAGYRAAMAEAGLPERIEQGEEPHEREDWCRRMAALFAAPGRPTGVLGYGRFSLYPAIQAAMTCGLAVPRDLSVAMIEAEDCVDLGPALSTWRIPHEAVGAAAAGMVLRALAGSHAQPALAVPFPSEPTGASIARTTA